MLSWALGTNVLNRGEARDSLQRESR
jgi:hypothetical protein